MLQFVDFDEKAGKDLMAKVNAWLQANPNVEIVSVTESCSSGNYTVHYSILYREKTA